VSGDPGRRLGACTVEAGAVKLLVLPLGETLGLGSAAWAFAFATGRGALIRGIGHGAAPLRFAGIVSDDPVGKGSLC